MSYPRVAGAGGGGGSATVLHIGNGDPRKMTPVERAQDFARGIARKDQKTPVAPSKSFNPFFFPLAGHD